VDYELSLSSEHNSNLKPSKSGIPVCVPGYQPFRTSEEYGLPAMKHTN
jgi:hypothetical protein